MMVYGKDHCNETIHTMQINSFYILGLKIKNNLWILRTPAFQINAAKKLKCWKYRDKGRTWRRQALMVHGIDHCITLNGLPMPNTTDKKIKEICKKMEK